MLSLRFTFSHRYRTLIPFSMLALTLGACSLSPEASKPAVYSTAALYTDFVERFTSDAAVSGPWVEQARAMTIRAAYDRMLARSTDDAYIVDGAQFSGTKTWLLKNGAFIAALDARYSNLGEFWDHSGAVTNPAGGQQISPADFTAELKTLAAWQPVFNTTGQGAPTGLGLVTPGLTGASAVPPRQFKLTPQPVGPCYPSYKPYTVQQHVNVAAEGRKDPANRWGPDTIAYDLYRGMTPAQVLEKHPPLQDLLNKGWVGPNYLIEDFSGDASSPLLPISCTTGESESQAMKRVSGQLESLGEQSDEPSF